MERRTHNRSPIRLDAVIHDDMFRSWPFVIENFGYDGLRLKWNNKTSMPDTIKEDDLLEVKFFIDQQGEQQEYHFEVKVVRILNNGLAVILFNPALDAMAQLSRTQLQDGLLGHPGLESSLNQKSRSILEALKQSYLNNLSHSTEIFLPIAHDFLFHVAENSKNNSDQARLFESINTLNKASNDLKLEFLALIKSQFEHCCHLEQLDQPDDELGELDLIDQNEFENWLVVNQLIVNISPHYKQELLEIKLRLAKLFAVSADKTELTPFSPEIIFKSFSKAIHNYFLSNDILLILYQQFEKVMDNHLFDIYKEINQIFIDNNVLPLIEKKKYEVVKQLSADTTPSADKEPLTDQAAEAEIQQIKTNTAPTATSPPATASHSDNTQQMVTNSDQHMTEINTIQNDVNLVPTYQTLKELLTFQSGQEFNKIPDDFFASENYKKQINSLIEKLTTQQKDQAENVSKGKSDSKDFINVVREQIKKENYSIEVKNEFEYTLDIIQRLFLSIERDQWLGKPVKKLLALLKIPLLKVSLLHKDFFESWSNPARMVLNKLAMVDFDDEKNHFYIKARSFVIYLLKNYESDLQLFSKIQEVLTQLLDIQSNHYNKNTNRIIKNWNTRQIVTNELATRLAGRSIPLVVADFVSYQWLPVLVSTYLNKGQDSSQWSQYLQALDMLILTMTGDVSEEFIDQDVILFIIKQGLDENNQYNKKVIDDIENFLKEGDDGKKIVLDLDSIIKLLINGYALSDKSAIAKISQSSIDAITAANKAIAKRLKVNDYVILKQGSKENKTSSRLQFIWGSDNQNVFVFAGRTEQQESVFNLIEVTSMLEDGQLSQTKDYDLPLLERTLYAIMGDVHDNIAKESSLDKVTGFIKRQEFERLFSQQLESNKQACPECVLCLIDIDQFSLINDTCSFEAGNKYLYEISQVISQHLPSQAIVSRYGIDEFALILPHHSESEAQEVAQEQRKAINHFSFNWENKEFTLSASIGMVSVPEYNEPGLFLKAVATATAIAKEMGRNRVHTLKYDAIELNHRQEIQHWATKVDHMVKNNQLDIRCQRLHPLLDDAINPHYEMLLLVKDELGNNTPPGEFIEAAELYNKMADVDRWVIHNVFKWYSEHPQQLEKMGGVAINLSGHSLNDVDFLSFIEAAFDEYSIPQERICFEITETVAITNLNHAINVVHAIKEMGCQFSLDDFGTGLASYAYLKNLPVDFLKIDGVFIKDICNNKADRAMVKSINELGHFMGMKTVAEYVENEEIITILKEIGVDYAQGFGVEMPVLMKSDLQTSAPVN